MTLFTSPEAFEDLTPTAAQSIGGGLGRGIGAGLSSLIQGKIQRLNEREKLKQLQSLLGRVPSAEGRMEQDRPRQDQEISDEQIQALTKLDPNLAKVVQSQKEARSKATEVKAKREFERAKPFLARMDERSEVAVQKENALELMQDSIKEGNLSFGSLDNLADITGIEAFRTPKGAQFISSGKEFFLGSIKRAGTRPNQWIEKQIQKMLPKIGRSEAANLTVSEALKSEVAVERAQFEIMNRLIEEDQREVGYIRGNIAERTRRDLREFAKAEQKELLIRLKEIQSAEKSLTLPRAKKANQQLTPALARRFLEASGGDKEKARELARINGYSF